MSSFNTPWFNSQESNFFNVLNKTKIPHVVLCAETEDFDEELIQTWTDEGFHTVYCPLLNGGENFIKRVHTIGDNFGVSEQYAIVAYGTAANLILEAHTKPNNPRLIAIVAYYPSIIPSVHTKYPASVQVLVHLAGTEISVEKHPEVLGIQGKRKNVKKRIDPGIGYGERLNIAFKTYTYTGCQPGFAESDLDEYDQVAASLAFTRTITTVRKGFRIENDIEAVRDHHVKHLHSGQEEKALKQIRPYGHVINTPTLTGGIGCEDLEEFYTNFFTPIPSNPDKSLQLRLLSRTIGTDRIVDELYLSLTHSQTIDWLLPGIPPTGKRIEIAVVSIFHVRGERLESEHVYWDQASVLVQAGLLDPKVVPGHLKKKGVSQLPVVGAEGARAIKRGSSRRVNELIPDW
ncbi:hypothetical protein AC579_7112 [Pseudocercospora musae]|uniref:SnoaL-like domain-containing protein n=1 Tax=Pseudocercospora musae TaxID=113226 RepID=A0A139IMS7_9PEZI|nr:hypothetical protein AC579_7112 [Pseudocercospora musae]